MQSEVDIESPPATIESAAWITGAWSGQGLGGYCDETWSVAEAGGMFGIFRLIKDDKLVFSEFMEIVEADGSILLRLKHFSPRLEGWEEKDKYVEFKLLKVTENELYFNGLTYKRVDEKTLEVYVVLDSGQESKEEKFSYHRVDN